MANRGTFQARPEGGLEQTPDRHRPFERVGGRVARGVLRHLPRPVPVPPKTQINMSRLGVSHGRSVLMWSSRGDAHRMQKPGLTARERALANHVQRPTIYHESRSSSKFLSVLGN